MTDPHLLQLVRSMVGDKAALDLLDTLKIDRAFLLESLGAVSRGVFAMALNTMLFHELLTHAPTAAAYVTDRRRQRERITFDHAALRTVRFGGRTLGASPPGVEACNRMLQPLGYDEATVEPQGDLSLTLHGFTHREFPETLPQFLVSELHVDRFSKEFQGAAARVFGSSRDPLTALGQSALAEFAEQGRCEMKLAVPALREIVAAFGRQHDTPALADYRILAAESAECAWIASDGRRLKHVADRVADVAMTACAQRSLGRPVKASIERSAAGTVRQTAFKPDSVRRKFRSADGSEVELTVPGAFWQLISRDLVTGPDGKQRLDLRLELPIDQGAPNAVLKRTAAG
jgi:hypothetical protein